MRRPADTVPEWEEEVAASRAETCIVFLAAHGLLSDREERNVRARLERSVAAWNARPSPPPTSATPRDKL